MGLSLKINEARITGFKLLSYESKMFSKDFSQVREGEWCPLLVLPKTLEMTNSSGSGRMNLCLGQFSITGTCRIQIYFTSELSDNSRPDDAPDEEEAHWVVPGLSPLFLPLPHLPSIPRGTQSCAAYSPLTVSNNYLSQTKCIWCWRDRTVRMWFTDSLNFKTEWYHR